MFFQKRGAVFVVAAALPRARASSAQTSEPYMSGAVRDPSGAPVAAAKVTVSNQDTGVSRSIQSDSEGRFLFNVLPGRYSLTAEAPGFKKETLTDMTLTVGMHLNRDVTLAVGNRSEE